MEIKPDTKKLSFVKLKVKPLGGIDFDKFTVAPAIDLADSTFTVNVPAGANLTSFIVTAKNAEFAPNQALEFSIVATGAGLTATGQTTHRLNFEAPTAIDEYVVENTRIYPNPAAEVLFISTPLDSYEIEITDLLGKTIQKIGYTREINTNNLSNGLYLMKLHTPQGTLTKKIVIRK